jgi:cell division transport system ATP-binding protein
VLKLEKVFKVFPEKTVALREVSFGLEKGEFVCLLGPNNAGKTTLLRLIAAQEKPTRGEIFFDGLSSTDIKQKQICHWRQKLGLICDEPQLVDDMSVFDNIALGLRILGEKEKQVRLRARKALDCVGLSNKSRAWAGCLSSAERQKTVIARAIVRDPILLLADEPTAGLDQESAGEIMMLLRKMNLFGTSVLLTSRELPPGTENPIRVIKMEKGRMVQSDSNVASSANHPGDERPISKTDVKVEVH